MFDELRHFLLVVEHGTFTEAARHAALSQPALSASIRRLEEQLEARLLERLPRGARPTAAGAALVPRARAALAAVEDGRRAVAEVTGLQAGEVRVGGGATACTYLLPQALTAYRQAYPQVTVRLVEVDTPAVPERVASGALDLGVCQLPTRQGVTEPWLTDELVLVADPAWLAEHPLGPGSPLVTFPRGTATATLVKQYLPQLQIIMELSSIATVKGHVRAGLGVALLSRAAVWRDLESGYLVEVPHPATPLRRELGLIHRGVDRLPPAACALREILLSQR